MAIEKITRAKGIIYRAVWVNPISGRRESKSFANELDAKQHEIDRRNAEARSSILLISTKKKAVRSRKSSCLFSWVMNMGNGVSNH
ncbi:MAG: hypothetical protein RBR38_10295 [Desulfomicrobium apsheronum]|jgi:hypothetical protein|nr:hypothetical protein [Desulfomicrobium apsheronum]